MRNVSAGSRARRRTSLRRWHATTRCTTSPGERGGTLRLTVFGIITAGRPERTSSSTVPIWAGGWSTGSGSLIRLRLTSCTSMTGMWSTRSAGSGIGRPSSPITRLSLGETGTPSAAGGHSLRSRGLNVTGGWSRNT